MIGTLMDRLAVAVVGSVTIDAIEVRKIPFHVKKHRHWLPARLQGAL